MRDRQADDRDRKRRKRKGDDMIVHNPRVREIIRRVTDKLRKPKLDGPVQMRSLRVARHF